MTQELKLTAHYLNHICATLLTINHLTTQRDFEKRTPKEEGSAVTQKAMQNLSALQLHFIIFCTSQSTTPSRQNSLGASFSVQKVPRVSFYRGFSYYVISLPTDILTSEALNACWIVLSFSRPLSRRKVSCSTAPVNSSVHTTLTNSDQNQTTIHV